MFVLEVPGATYAHLSQMNPQSSEQRYFPSFDVITTYPQAKTYVAHQSWPEKIKKAFVEIQELADERRSPALIVTQCRAILDVATKELGAEGRNIYDRINNLLEKQILTVGVAEWAHALRNLGADAVHDLDGGDENQARELVEFIRLMLHVTFELPAEIAAKKAANTPGAAALN